MLKRFALAVASAALVLTCLATTASAASPSDRDPIPPPTDYWQDKGFILMAHQGGEWDFPPNTLFSYKSAMAIGADMIDMDAYVTRDGEIVLTHDLDARKNSNLTDDMFEGRHDINELDLSELKTLDFAYKWSPRDGSAVTPYRGVATGSTPPPEGFQPSDFRIPTFEEVLEAFPDTPINIELKQVGELTPADIQETAETMADILAGHPGHDENVIINSFGQEMLDAMHAARPQHKSYSGSQSGLLGYISGQPITPTPVAVEPPDYFFLNPPGAWLRTVPVLKPWADHDGYKIYVWGSDHDPLQDTDAFYAKLIEEGADSYNTPSPTTLAAYLCSAGIAKPDGSPRCPEQECPEGSTGIAPDDCHRVCPDGTEAVGDDCQKLCPVGTVQQGNECGCPPGMVGTPPNCGQVIVDPKTILKKVVIKPKFRKVRAGKKVKLRIKIRAEVGLAPRQFRIKLRSSNRRVKVPRSVVVRLSRTNGRYATGSKVIKVRAKRNARGKAVITARNGKLKARARIKVKKRHRATKRHRASKRHHARR